MPDITGIETMVSEKTPEIHILLFCRSASLLLRARFYRPGPMTYFDFSIYNFYESTEISYTLSSLFKVFFLPEIFLYFHRYYHIF